MPAAPASPSGLGTKIAAVVLAVFFLAVIGASTGYILGLRHRHAQQVQNRADNQPTDPTATATRTRGTTPPPPPPAGTTARRCLDESEKTAKSKYSSPGSLVQVFYLRTDASEVWICRDSDKTLFYQGHVRSNTEKQGGDRPPLVDLQNALLLKAQAQGNGWLAENVDADSGNTTRYRVSPDELVVERPNRSPDHQKAVYHEP
jgi:hypothetical protein